MDYKERIQTLADELEEHPGIVLRKRKIAGGAPDWYVSDMTELFGVNVSDEVLRLYESVNGLYIEWSCDIAAAGLKRYSEDESRASIGGRIRLHSLDDMLRGDERPDDPGWTDRMDEVEVEDLQKFCVLDYNDDDIRVGFIVEEGFLQNELWYLLQKSEGFGPVQCGVDQYMEALRESRGFQPWQRTFAFRESTVELENSRMVHYISQLFPEESFDHFRM